MSDGELITWARIYFNGIPDSSRLPSDRRLSSAVNMSRNLTAEQRSELMWIRRLVEEDIVWTPKHSKKG